MIVTNLFRSLLLTVVFAFVAPIIFVGGLLAALYLLNYVPGVGIVGHFGVTVVEEFLTVFGSGYPLQGLLTIGLTSSLAGGLFDICNYYRYQSLGGH